jgi:hypothetical protein
MISVITNFSTARLGLIKILPTEINVINIYLRNSIGNKDIFEFSSNLYKFAYEVIESFKFKEKSLNVSELIKMIGLFEGVHSQIIKYTVCFKIRDDLNYYY